MSLPLIRKKIEEIDEKIITLLGQRFRFLPEIIEEKMLIILVSCCDATHK